MKQKYIHFIGIGGISMSALAKICLKKGYRVTGSDSHENEEIASLRKMGATIEIGHEASHITHPDLVVYTGAIPSTNVERVAATELGIRTVERAEFLGELADEYATTIAIAGTHGKTTTTSLLGWIFEVANCRPTVHIGGECLNFQSNMVIGQEEYFITEACEYRNSMRFLHPAIAIITSIEADHMDCYKDMKELENAFYHFAKGATFVISTLKLPVSKNQHLLYCSLDKDDFCEEAYHNYTLLSYKEDEGMCTFEVAKDGKYFGHFLLAMHGKYNIANALNAIAVADLEGIDYLTIYQALKTFLGVKRRYEKLGTIEQKVVIADYAHHPTEIASVLGTLQTFYPKLLVVFQPHTYSRTKSLLSEFKKVLSGVKYLAMLPTYPAREAFDKEGDSYTLFQKVKNKNKRYIEKLEELPTKWLDACDAIVLVGAGDIYDQGKRWLENLPEKIKK